MLVRRREPVDAVPGIGKDVAVPALTAVVIGQLDPREPARRHPILQRLVPNKRADSKLSARPGRSSFSILAP